MKQIDCDTSKNLECKAGAWYKYHKTKNVKEDITTKRCVEKCNSGEVLNNCLSLLINQVLN